jgi:uncharacterized protein (TIGR03000 family)
MGNQDYYTENQGGFSQPYMRGQQTYSYGSEMEGQAPQDPNTARIIVHVPANAEIQFEGQKTQQRGSTRQFVSPPLKSGKEYTYDVKAEWMENGRNVSQERQINVRPGASVTVDFMRGPEGRPATRMDRRFERRYGAPPERQGNFEPQDRTGTFEQRDLQQGVPSSDQRANPSKDKTPSSDQRTTPSKDKTPSNPSKDKTSSPDQRSKDRENNSGTGKP